MHGGLFRWEPLGRSHRWFLLSAFLLVFCRASLAQQPQGGEVDARSESIDSSPDPSTSELLAEILEANRYWFEGPPKRVPAYRYALVLSDGKRQEFRVDDPQTAEVRVKRGITYMPLVGQVFEALVDSKSNGATVGAVERSDGEIRIRFQTNGSLAPRLGGGVLGSWNGYLPFRLGRGTIRLDAASLMPTELTSVWRDDRHHSETLVTEKLSEPYEVDGGHWVPLRVEADTRRNTIMDGQRKPSGHDRFDWAFRVYEPGLWLFDAQLIAEGTALGYHLEDVVVGEAEEAAARATSVAVAAIRGSREDTKSIVDQYVETNRGWLLPDREKRQGLVYDYRQEDGYRERVVFDHQGNVLVQLASKRQSSKHSFAGSQHLFTADGREVRGVADEPYVKVHALDPASTGPDRGSEVLPCLATGWGWQCASMDLARGADDFAIAVDPRVKKKTWKLTMRPRHGQATFTVGTVLRYSSWASLRKSRYSRCDIEIDRESGLPIMETYFVKWMAQPFCTIRFEDWLDTAEGKAPGKVVGCAAYQKRGKLIPETRKREAIEELFRFTGTHRVTEAGLLLLDEVESTFESMGDESTGRVTVVAATDEDYRPLQEALKRADATVELLAKAEKAARGFSKTVPCWWGEEVPVWLNGKYENTIIGRGAQLRGLPFAAYRDNLGIQDLCPELLADGTIRVTVNVYSTLYYQGYDFDLILGLVDGNGQVLAEQTVSEKTQTLDRPEQKQIVFDIDGGVDPDKVASIAVSLKIKRRWGRLLSIWGTTGSLGNNDRESVYLPGARDWGPEQAIGEPTGRHVGGDYRHAWSSLTEDGQEEWLELTYAERILAVGVNVYENFNPGAVHKVTYYDESCEERLAWEGDDPTPPDVQIGRGVSEIRFDRAVKTDRIRICLDSPRVKGWNEIDAVCLVGIPMRQMPKERPDRVASPSPRAYIDPDLLVYASSIGIHCHEHWAVDATASSTFADEPRPETLTYLYGGPHRELKNDSGLAHCQRGTWDSEWQVMRFRRPKDTPSLEAVRVLGTVVGERPEMTTLYVLDEEMKVLEEISTGTRIRRRGSMKWYAYPLASLEVPETFYVAFDFHSLKNEGVFLATQRLAEGETGHSYFGAEGQELRPLAVQGAASDWMIRAYLAEKPNLDSSHQAPP